MGQETFKHWKRRKEDEEEVPLKKHNTSAIEHPATQIGKNRNNNNNKSSKNKDNINVK